jgi:LAS superfamily LD-carboxypeptidase LdcB
MGAATFEPMRIDQMLRRPFVVATRQGQCPAPPPPSGLAAAKPQETYDGMTIQLRQGALEAYRRLVAAAREADPGIAADPQLLTLISGYRGPADEAARCADGACNRRERATCSPHRTGLAMDLYLGAAPGYRPDSSADANRLYMSRTPAYRWLVANAGRFGFLPYPFEPWHWEWTGEAP